MSDNSHSEKPKAGAESPTTARELDFDDDHDHDESRAMKSPTPKQVSFVEVEDEDAPSKPTRPLSPQSQNEKTLKEAFPTIDPKVIKAVLIASNGNVEPAFNALLDPDFKPEEAPPPQPPRPTQAQRQLDSDEQYARQLAQHFQSESRPRRTMRDEDDRGPPLPNRPRQQRPGPGEDDREYSFFDDDLPQIKENVRKGFLETQTKVNKWITAFTKKLDGEDNDDPYNGPTRQDSPPRRQNYRRQNYGPSQSEQLYGIRRSADVSRKSTDKDRYDSDNRVLDDDFTALELRDDEGSLDYNRLGLYTLTLNPAPHRASSSRNRPLANPDLYKANVAPPQSGPVDEVDAIDRRNQRQPSPGAASKSAKWQPLTSIAPNPESDENDPFSLGDSDDEKETKTKDIKESDTARLKEAARESVTAESADAPKTLQASERSGSSNVRDKEAEAILTGKKA
ncbi:hypothetical protein E4T38_03750 [Aureobasidium subglaciale]|nr:hypothetical protein E4T38_03750 [Aureobasidium subglaciale]KAI5224955.1 hypothetical protein E4T41_05498 [Aureobasidium subglaciale]KAI5225348.1 hypothetical protein E4T40_03525 [Aureobasidium subglaciale]KAI5261209.1 hypothetical protein E4T46_05391 [Aureobasidium subglaciale]